MDANALETAGAAATPCRHCDQYVYIETDDGGRVYAISAGEAGSYLARGEGRVSYRRTLLPLLFGALAILFLGWVAATRYCSGPVAQPALTAEPAPTPTLAPTPQPTAATPRPIVLDSLSGVNFEFDRADLHDSERQVLSEVAKMIKSMPASTVYEIGGHTDNLGSEEHNKQLSLQRAETVRKFLIERGVPAAALKVKGYGATQPVASNETEYGQAQNRRIEFTLVK